MTELEGFVKGLQSRLATIDVDDFFAELRAAKERYRDFMFSLIVSSRLNLEQLWRDLAAILGDAQVAALFDHVPAPFPAAGELTMILFPLIQNLSEVMPDGTVRLDEQTMLAHLTQLAGIVEQGELDYSISLHFTNIDIDEEFEIAPGIRFVRLTPFEVRDRYSIDDRFHGASGFIQDNWLNHCVDAVLERRGRMSDVHRFRNIDYMETFLHSIVHPFILAGLGASGPHVTHLRVDTAISSELMYLGTGNRFSVHPTKLLQSEIERLRRAYALLQDAANDRVLATAIERFILGYGRSEHHPHHMNEPNWDKIVDYVIAMETLFLGKVNQELSYRCALNGSAVLSACVGHGRRAIFEALRELYVLRSKIVHGASLSKIQEPADKFIKRLGLELGTRGQFDLVAKTVEEWLLAAMFHFGGMAIEQRPFHKNGGWEDLLFDGLDPKES